MGDERALRVMSERLLAIGEQACGGPVADGFVAGPNVDVENPLGDHGVRLHDWMFRDRPPAVGRS
jgi:hypothetical protein